MVLTFDYTVTLMLTMTDYYYYICCCYSDEIRGMIPQELLHANDMLNSVDGYSRSAPQLQGLSEGWLAFPKIVSIIYH